MVMEAPGSARLQLLNDYHMRWGDLATLLLGSVQAVMLARKRIFTPADQLAPAFSGETK